MWTEVGTTDALELLGPSMGDSRVRSFAVKHLKRADDDVSMLRLSMRKLVELIRVECVGIAAVSATAGAGFEVRKPAVIFDERQRQWLGRLFDRARGG